MVKATASPIVDLIRRAVEAPRLRELSDPELLQRFSAQQDPAAFQALLRRHGSMVLDVCRGVLSSEADAEDAFQATFLIFARNARSIRKSASVGSWLHGVAYRTALKARAQSATRDRHEARVAARQAAEPEEDPSWREVRQVLHEELRGLPERYRAPLVLCYLEGATQEAAAGQLHLAKSTLRERLERGRALLRARLMRRGLGPAALLVAASWPAASASACVSPSVMSSTVQAASLLAAGKMAATGLISGKVAALTEGALKAMLMTKLKALTAVVLAAALVGSGAVLLTFGPVRAEPQNAKSADEPRPDEKAKPGEAEEKDKQALQGKWTIVTFEKGGKVNAANQGRPFVFKGDEFTIKTPKGDIKGTYKLDPTAKPRAIDLVITEGDGQGETVLGIYLLEKDGLKLCVSVPGGKDRPTAFAAGADSGHILITLEREK